MNDCSVVIVSYYTGPLLFACIKSVLRQKQLAQLVVVDNGNPPDVVARMQQLALGEERLSIVTGQGNIGFAKSCNLAAKQCTGEFILLLDPDCLLPPDALVQLMKAINDTPEAMLAGGELHNPNGSYFRGPLKENTTPVTILMESLGLNRLRKLRDVYTQPKMDDSVCEVSSVPAACMCMRNADYQRLFGLDEGFFLQSAGLDMCQRVHKIGGKVVSVPSVKLTFLPDKRKKKKIRFIEWQRAKGYMRYCKKHFEGRYVPGFLLLVYAAVILRYVINSSFKRLYRYAQGRQSKHNSVIDKRLMILATGLAELPETQSLHGKVVLVTGATSQVGLCVVKRLLAAGAAVLAISRGPIIAFQHEQLRWIIGDLTAEDLHLEGYLVDAVVHCAPLWHLPPIIDLLLDAEVKRIIAFGSTSVFANAGTRNSYEKDVVEKLTKAEADIAAHCASKGMRNWTIFRPTMTYGVGLDLNITSLAKFIENFHFFPVYPPAFGKRQPVHADDLAIAALQSMQNENTYEKSYNLSGGETLTYREMLERIFTLYHEKPRIIVTTMLPFLLNIAGLLLRKKHINAEIAYRMNDDLMFFYDEAKRDFNFSPRRFLKGGINDIEGF